MTQGIILFRFTLVLFLLTYSHLGTAQQSLTWEDLADVTFSEKYDEELQAYWLIPDFGAKPKSFAGKDVIIMGYFIPFNVDDDFYVLSKNPYSSCFFCGQAGPETVMELQVADPLPDRIRIDQRLFFRGTLELNKSDLNHCNYILKDARPVFADQ